MQRSPFSVAFAAALVLGGCQGNDGPTGPEVVGEITVALDVSKCTVRAEESLVGNFVADAVADAFPEADAVLINGGSLRFDDATHPDGILPAGSYTEEDLINLLPFGNTVSLITLTGEQLVGVLEHGVNALLAPVPATEDECRGWFFQVSGLQFTVDTAKQAEIFDSEAVPPAILTPGERIGDVELGGVAIDLAASYRVASAPFVMDGGDGHVGFADGSDRLDSDIQVLDAVKEYLQAQTPVTPELEGRITVQ